MNFPLFTTQSRHKTSKNRCILFDNTQFGKANGNGREDWKYIYSECGALEELYDQRNDRSELTNLANQSEYSTLLHDMRDKLKQCARKFKDISLFDGKQLVASPLDRGKINEQLSYGMGWRWY